MDSKSYKVTAPGSLMLMGEHAVLYGSQALVTAINRYITVELTLRSDPIIKLDSPLFGAYQVPLDALVISAPYNYVLLAIQQYLPKITQGFCLHIDSDFPADIGFGSSAAVTIATLGVLELCFGSKTLDLSQLYQLAVRVVRLAQGGVGSGADVAASIFGGVLAYTMDPVQIDKLTLALPLVAIYSGSKTITSEVIALVAAKMKRWPALCAQLFQLINGGVREALGVLTQQEFHRFGELLNLQQGLLAALGVSNALLAELIYGLRQYPQVPSGTATPYIYGAKISGSGLGDCVIGLGKIDANSFPQTPRQKALGVKQVEIAVSSSGVVVL